MRHIRNAIMLTYMHWAYIHQLFKAFIGHSGGRSWGQTVPIFQPADSCLILALWSCRFDSIAINLTDRIYLGVQVGEEFGCLAMTLEMPFKDTVDTPDPVKGWSPERSLVGSLDDNSTIFSGLFMHSMDPEL